MKPPRWAARAPRSAPGIEREVLSTCRRYGMGVRVWSPLASCLLPCRNRKGRPTTPSARMRCVPRHLPVTHLATVTLDDLLEEDRRDLGAGHRPRPRRLGLHPALTEASLRRRPAGKRAAA